MVSQTRVRTQVCQVEAVQRGLYQALSLSIYNQHLRPAQLDDVLYQYLQVLSKSAQQGKVFADCGFFTLLVHQHYFDDAYAFDLIAALHAIDGAQLHLRSLLLALSSLPSVSSKVADLILSLGDDYLDEAVMFQHQGSFSVEQNIELSVCQIFAYLRSHAPFRWMQL